LTVFTKIRILLALLCVSFLLTAVIVRSTYTPRHSFIKSAQTLETNLHQKEKQVEKLFTGSSFEQLKTLPDNHQKSLSLIEQLTVKDRIWLVTYRNNKVKFWTGIKILPPNYKKFKEGNSFAKEENGYFEVVRKTEGDFTAIAFIFIKNNFRIQNQYLTNVFEPQLLDARNIDIADIGDKDVYHVHDVNKHYLFSVKASSDAVNYNFAKLEFTLWVIGILALCALVTSFCNHLVYQKKVGAAFLLLSVFIVGIRVTGLFFRVPDFSSRMHIFNSDLFSYGFLLPTLGDFCLNILGLCWLMAFIYYHRYKILNRPLHGIWAWVVYIGGVMLLIAASTLLTYLSGLLVLHSRINFDVNNVLNLSLYSMIGLLMLCFSFLIFYLLTETLLIINRYVYINDRAKLGIFAGAIIIATVISAFYALSWLYISWALLVFIRIYASRYDDGELDIISYVAILLLCSCIAATELNYYESVKEHVVREQLIKELDNGDDPKVTHVFKTVEKQIINDPVLQQYLKSHNYYTGYLKNRFERFYFDGYLSDYDCKIHEFDSAGAPISADNKYVLDDFKNMVMFSSAYKVSDYFYRENNNFGIHSYFAILPVYEYDRSLGTVIVELKSKPVQATASFPELLIDKPLASDNRFKAYSYAFYNDGKLVSQSGSYNYNVVNTELKGKLKQNVFKTTAENYDDGPGFHKLIRYNHLIYQPSLRKVIIVSRPDNSWITFLASLTFFFVSLLVFSGFILLVNWLRKHISILEFTPHSVHWKFGFHFDHLLYKTRIQLSMILAVLTTLTLVGVITFLSIRAQYQQQQDEIISNKVIAIAAKFDNVFTQDINHVDEKTQTAFNSLADDFSTDLILFNASGIPILYTQPKIYDYGILGKRMHAKAYILLNKLQKSVLINNERIGTLNYKAAYVPIRNTRTSATIGYLQLPYFANEADYRERIGAFLNAMINIYALIFLAIGVFAVLIARKITAPLSFIQHNLSKTMYGKKNEPIKWERDDEIGALVKEYNKMISALEESAQRLAQSERESAWREMAKQVAHEIKNPLTPLKLGLQLLEKSWRDKDPRFDAKFERFSKSFVEQIESLSSIASEFSAFAKMPDTKMQRLALFEILGQAVVIFKHMENVRIIYQAPEQEFMIMADRDQLLRCFNNLLKNAIEAMPEGRFGIIDITYTYNLNSMLLQIKDNGNGIPENLRERIFEPNFTTKSSGTGLGLAFVKNSIENAGGKVWYETIAGEGTTFFLNFPEAKKA
jgi:two-component system nitrogen regulation sensor histidine kinase NtrY